MNSDSVRDTNSADLAIDNDHEIIPVLNKIDLPASDVDRVAEQIEEVIVALRQISPPYEEDRSLSSDIRRVAATIDDGNYCHYAASVMPSLST